MRYIKETVQRDFCNPSLALNLVNNLQFVFFQQTKKSVYSKICGVKRPRKVFFVSIVREFYFNLFTHLCGTVPLTFTWIYIYVQKENVKSDKLYSLLVRRNVCTNKQVPTPPPPTHTANTSETRFFNSEQSQSNSVFTTTCPADRAGEELTPLNSSAPCNDQKPSLRSSAIPSALPCMRIRHFDRFC